MKETLDTEFFYSKVVLYTPDIGAAIKIAYAEHITLGETWDQAEL